MSSFRWVDDTRGTLRAFTSRHGGVSRAPFGSLNLGDHVGDDPVAVRSNRASVAQALSLDVRRLVFMDQQHGADVAVVTRPMAEPPSVDAVVTTEPDLALAVLVADCTPVLLSDRTGRVVAAAHAGRPGFMAGIVDRVVTTMRELGAGELSAVVGPSVCSRCYEVPMEMREEAREVVPESAAVSWRGTPAVDVAGGVVRQLRANDVDVTWLPGCTREDDSLFSYRRDSSTGRTAGIVRRSVT